MAEIRRPALEETFVEEKKWCPGCDGWVPRSGFHRNTRRPDGLQAYCIKCHNERRRELPDRPRVPKPRRNEQPAFYRALMILADLHPDEFEQIWAEQLWARNNWSRDP